MSVEYVPDHKFPSGIDVPLAVLSVRVDELADALNITLQEWEEDGLGTARGCFLRLSSGRVVLLRELEHAVRHRGARGPVVLVDAGDAVALGMRAFMVEVVADLKLSPEQIAQTHEDATVWSDDAAKLVELAQRWRNEHRE